MRTRLSRWSACASPTSPSCTRCAPGQAAATPTCAPQLLRPGQRAPRTSARPPPGSRPPPQGPGTHPLPLQPLQPLPPPQYGVDLVLNGHVHAYERSKPVYNYTLDPCGPVHVTGAPPPPRWTGFDRAPQSSGPTPPLPSPCTLPSHALSSTSTRPSPHTYQQTSTVGCGGKPGIETGSYALDTKFLEAAPQARWCADPKMLDEKPNPTQPLRCVAAGGGGVFWGTGLRRCAAVGSRPPLRPCLCLECATRTLLLSRPSPPQPAPPRLGPPSKVPHLPAQARRLLLEPPARLQRLPRARVRPRLPGADQCNHRQVEVAAQQRQAQAVGGRNRNQPRRAAVQEPRAGVRRPRDVPARVAALRRLAAVRRGQTDGRGCWAARPSGGVPAARLIRCSLETPCPRPRLAIGRVARGAAVPSSYKR
jgi:hypothetical protein